jgi:phosphoglycerol transferase MdoB-like AlkP superfamily enzyme
MTLLGVIRPDDWNFPLFLHLVGAMTLVGALILVGVSLVGAGRGGSVAVVRLGFRGLLFAALPAWLLLRVTAEWLASEENLDEDTPGWVDVGYMTSDTTLLLLIAATVCAGLASRRARREGLRGSGLSVAVVVLVAISLVAYVFAIWAMTTKPS